MNITKMIIALFINDVVQSYMSLYIQITIGLILVICFVLAVLFTAELIHRVRNTKDTAIAVRQ